MGITHIFFLLNVNFASNILHPGQQDREINYHTCHITK